VEGLLLVEKDLPKGDEEKEKRVEVNELLGNDLPTWSRINE